MGLWRALVTADRPLDVIRAASAPLTHIPVQGYDVTMPAEVASAFGVTLGTDVVSRAEAMSIPAVRRGRAIICGTLGTAPLVARLKSNQELVPRPLLRQPDPNTTRQHVITWTVEDLVLYGMAWWRVTSRNAEGFPATAERLRRDRVMIDVERGTVRVDGHRVADADLIRFDGPDEGILTGSGGRTLRTTIMLEQAVRRFARLDVPLGVLEQVEGSPNLTDEQVETFLARWERQRERHTTGFLNGAVRYKPAAFDAEKIQLAEARAYQNAEVARLLNLPGRYVGASDGDSMTYSNSESARRDLVDLSLAPYVAALQERLSLDDVTPSTQEVRLDLTAFLRGDTTTALGWAKTAVEIGAMTAAEVRTDVLNRPALEGPAND